MSLSKHGLNSCHGMSPYGSCLQPHSAQLCVASGNHNKDTNHVCSVFICVNTGLNMPCYMHVKIRGRHHPPPRQCESLPFTLFEMTCLACSHAWQDLSVHLSCSPPHTHTPHLAMSTGITDKGHRIQVYTSPGDLNSGLAACSSSS